MRARRGYTILELSLSVAIITILLLGIIYVSIHTNNIYQKGIAIKNVSTGGTELLDAFSRIISTSVSSSATVDCMFFGSSSARTNCENDNAYRLTYQEYYLDDGNPAGGVFCTGKYSLLWNSGHAIKQHDTSTYGGSEYRLLQIDDTNRSACKAGYSSSGTYNSNVRQSNYSLPDTSNPVELLQQEDGDLVLYDLVIFPPRQHAVSLQTFYSGTFILSTIAGEVNILGDGNFCANPGISTDFYYCAINKYNFAMRATGR